jgi:hypothetical protein
MRRASHCRRRWVLPRTHQGPERRRGCPTLVRHDSSSVNPPGRLIWCGPSGIQRIHGFVGVAVLESFGIPRIEVREAAPFFSPLGMRPTSVLSHA